MDNNQTQDAQSVTQEAMDRALNSALRFAGSRSAITGAEETAIRAAWSNLGNQLERPGHSDDCRAREDWSDDDVEQLVHELSYALEVAELNRDDYVTVNRAKLTTIAKRILGRAPLHRLASQPTSAEDAVSLAGRLEALAGDCDNTDGWQGASADVRQAAEIIRTVSRPTPETQTAAIGAEVMRKIAAVVTDIREGNRRLNEGLNEIAALSQPVAAPQAEVDYCDKCDDSGYAVENGKQVFCDCVCGHDAMDQAEGKGLHALSTPPQPEGGMVADVKREIMERSRHMVGSLADLRSTVDLDDESSDSVLGYCDDLETAVHNIGAVASHLPAALQPEKTKP